MTKQQLKRAMEAAGLAGELSGRGSQWELELAGEAELEQFDSLGIDYSGFKTGYGAWILRPAGPRSSVDDLPYCHPASPHHY